MRGALDKLTVKGFKSIKELNEFKLGDLNVIIGANGAGKSNFVQIFRMLMAMTQKNFSKFILERGGADNFLFNGPKVTQSINMEFEFASLSSFSDGSNSYKFELTPTADEEFLISEERKYINTNWRPYGGPSKESRLYDMRNEKSMNGEWNGVGHFVYESISNWMVYHFHDTGDRSPMRRSEIVEDYHKLRGDEANIAPFLLHLKNDDYFAGYYKKIVDAVRLVIPFFDDFRLDVQRLGEAEKVRLSWSQKGSDFPMQPYHLSDGSIRFICLATALLQPSPPSTIIIDEPELGLHPAAIVVLAELIQAASKQTQVIVATQSPALIDQFGIEDIIVINRQDGASTFERLKEKDFSAWLDDYSVGELWSKNVIAGGPVYE
ncbi:AAA family ATPase [Desulfobacter latus]|uniref:AAA family ATPase n=1 Tax=Desulfobacter latus TaxID=2292 RepID=A0A850T602_9BACT|nr:AAA family ATPase [Desulfobacter latus]NWH03748.1 AAA family ATPase [Desulfobacter latus]